MGKGLKGQGEAILGETGLEATAAISAFARRSLQEGEKAFSKRRCAHRRRARPRSASLPRSAGAFRAAALAGRGRDLDADALD